MAEENKNNNYNEFGFSSTKESSAAKYINRDGTFNVRRKGVSRFEALTLYHYFTHISWKMFLFIFFLLFLAINTFFAVGFMLLDEAPNVETIWEQFVSNFLLSTQTFTTVGYGKLLPNGILSNLWAILDAFFGLVGFALMTGLMYARFAQPKNGIKFSHNLLMSKYKSGTGLMFRMVDVNESDLIDAEVQVMLGLRHKDSEKREIHTLKLELDKIPFFVLSWTIVHPIDETSPLYGLSEKDCQEADIEVFVLCTAYDSTYSQRIHTQTAYQGEDLIWNANFKIIHQQSGDNFTEIDVSKLNEYVVNES